ncbi:diacylglycerol kinase family lipid kinase [Flexivirga sp. ID2601S]|uniref:Diacylglycerol kinase family lipid kinase n=1 Tax=Flexivirga aerilata TaxID=1656889 RepID=A0A849ABC5_9MICO|nr:diacylglycerol kinase family lipid kinase [Flexivirga aerilata]
MRRGAVIVNPTKVADTAQLRAELAAIFREHGWADPLWWETTVEEPGRRQALEAVDAGVDLVAALGGDGTVRCVAAGVLPSRTPVAVLASGTGNLLARQLKLPVGHFERALRVALGGVDHEIDVMRISLDENGSGQFDAEEIGLVMSGIGVDADIMAATTEELKGRIGWLAYPAAGLRQVVHDLVPATICFDDGVKLERDVTSVLVGNCGMLQGGMKLMPDAVVDDGLLNAVVVRGSGLRWLPVIAKVLTRSRRNSVALTRHLCREAVVSVDRPAGVEVDGDVIGTARAVRFAVDPGALVLRLPQ